MPRYTQFPRSNVAGNVPTRIDPGSIAINWADRKIFTGGPNSEPLLMAYRLSDHDSSRSYRTEDIVYHEGSLWRCTVAFTTGTFNPQQWLELTDINTAPYKELSGTVLTEGGTIAINGTKISVAAGSGVVMELSDPADPSISPISWTSSELSEPFTLNDRVVVGVDGNGAIVVVDFNDPSMDAEWRRRHIVLGSFTTDSTGNPVTVDTQSVTQNQTRETLSDLLSVISPFKVSGIEMNFSATSELRMASGEVFWHGLRPFTNNPNLLDVATIQPYPVYQASRNGYETAGLGTVLDVASWDDGGVLTAVPADTWTTQFVFLSSSLTDGVAVYGQKTYAALDSALDDVGVAWDELARPAVTSNMILLCAVVSNATGVSQSIVNTTEGFRDPFGGSGSGGGSTSQFLLISGDRPMTGDLDLGGNGIENGLIDGENVEIKLKEYLDTGEPEITVSSQTSINSTDKKIFAGSLPVADRVEVYNAAREYALGDKTIESNNLYLCTTAVTTPEAFDPAKWQLIGADNSGALTQAVVLQPDAAGRNTIDVTGQGGVVAAMKTTFDNGQSVPLYEFSDNAQISRFGLPVKAFGEDVFRVSQVNHLFTAIGTAVYFNGTQWLLADNTNPSLFPQAVVHEIIDTDNFLLQVGGRINDLDPAAFVGGTAPVAGEFYYASDQPGLLTNVEGATPVPVLYALSSTTALVKLTGTRIPSTLTGEQVIDLVYPVGSTYISVDPANPAVRWPGTTWVADGEGRAIVGVGNNGESNWLVGEERGSETHTLTTPQLPSHQHSILEQTVSTEQHEESFGWSSRRTQNNADLLFLLDNIDVDFTTSDNRIQLTSQNGAVTDYSFNIDHSHQLTIPESNSGQTGGGEAHNNLQPSKAFYIWRRTA